MEGLKAPEIKEFLQSRQIMDNRNQPELWSELWSNDDFEQAKLPKIQYFQGFSIGMEEGFDPVATRTTANMPANVRFFVVA